MIDDEESDHGKVLASENTLRKSLETCPENPVSAHTIAPRGRRGIETANLRIGWSCPSDRPARTTGVVNYSCLRPASFLGSPRQDLTSVHAVMHGLNRGDKTMGYAKHVGRVGALAVALGIGA